MECLCLCCRCSWKGKPCKNITEDFTTSLTEFGLCHTFNFRKPALFATGAGIEWNMPFYVAWPFHSKSEIVGTFPSPFFQDLQMAWVCCSMWRCMSTWRDLTLMQESRSEGVFHRVLFSSKLYEQVEVRKTHNNKKEILNNNQVCSGKIHCFLQFLGFCWQVHLHDQEEMPNMEEQGCVAAAGTHTLVAVAKKQVNWWSMRKLFCQCATFLPFYCGLWFNISTPFADIKSPWSFWRLWRLESQTNQRMSTAVQDRVDCGKMQLS